MIDETGRGEPPEAKRKVTSEEVTRIAREILQLELDQPALDQLARDVNSRLAMGLDTGVSAEDLIIQKLRAFRDAKKQDENFMSAYFAAKTNFEKLGVKNTFFILDKNNPNKLRKQLLVFKDYKTPTACLVMLASQFEKIGKMFGAPIDPEKSCFIIRRDRELLLYEGKITGISREGSVIFKGPGKTGIFTFDDDVFNNRNEAEKRLARYKGSL